jgi:hypothetical protein
MSIGLVDEFADVKLYAVTLLQNMLVSRHILMDNRVRVHVLTVLAKFKLKNAGLAHGGPFSSSRPHNTNNNVFPI